MNAPYGVDTHSDVHLGKDSDDEEEEDKEEDDKEEKDEEKEDEDEEEDDHKDDGKEHQMIGQGEMVNTSPDNVDTMVDNEAIVLYEQGQGMCDHTPRPQPLAPAPRRQTLEPYPPPQTPRTHLLSGQEFLGLLTASNPSPVVLTL